MTRSRRSYKSLANELNRVSQRLAEAEDTIRAIRQGEVDALVVAGPNGEQLFTLKSAEQPYRLLIERTNEGVLTLSAEGLILYCNRRFAELLNIPLETLAGQELKLLILPAERPAFQALLDAGRAGQANGAFTVQKSNGPCLRIMLSVCRLPADSAASFGVIVADVTETQRKEQELLSARNELERRVAERTAQLSTQIAECTFAETALRESEQKFRSLFEMCSDAIMVSDPEQFIDCNRAAVKLFGYCTKEELLGKLPAELCPPTQPDGQDSAKALAARIAAVCAGGSQVFEFWHRRNEGTEFLAEVSLQLLKVNQRQLIQGVVRDISQRRQAEDAVRQSEARFRDLAENIRQVFWLASPDFSQTLYLSPAFETIWGRSCQTVYDNAFSWLEAVHPEDRERVAGNIEKQAQLSFDMQYRIVRPDGELRWIHDRSFPVHDEQGRLKRVAGLAEDITERKRVENALAHEAGINSALAEISTALISDRPLEEISRLVLQTAQHLTRSEFGFVGYLQPETGWLICPTMTRTVWDACEVADKSVVLKKFGGLWGWVLNHRQSLLSNDPAHDPRSGGTPPGHIPIRRVICVPAMLGETLVGEIAVVNADQYVEGDLRVMERLAALYALAVRRQRTQETLQESEQRFRHLAENIQQVFWLSTPDVSRVLYLSPAFEKIWGRPCQSVYDDPLAWLEAIHPEDRPRMTGAIDQHAQGEYKVEYRIVRPDGTIRWILDRGFPVRDHKGNLELIAGFAEDITERKMTEARVAALHKELLETSRQAGMAEVATSILHNVGNVLNSVNVTASVAREKLRKSKVSYVGRAAELMNSHRHELAEFLAHDPKGKQLPGYLSDLAVRLAQEQELLSTELGSLVHDIEHIKDIIAMQQSYARVSGVSEPVALSDLLEDALRITAAGMERHHVSIIRKYGELRPVITEKHKVLQILINLLQNAKYALDAGAGTDRQLILETQPTSNGRARISVTDNGIGIPAENLTRIFNMGFTTRKGGHGFGLHNGALTAKELGGSLTAQSNGVGATFVLELPYEVKSL